MEFNEPISKEVSGVQFSIMSPDEIRKQSVVEITKHDTYDKDIPIIKGLFDPRMGTTDMGRLCNTCGLSNKDCPGHFGHIELSEPVLHIAFVDNIYKLLQSTCRSCGRIKMSSEDITEFRKIKAAISLK